MCDEIRIYVADLAAYNNGHLHGVWINACDDVDDIQAAINEMLEISPCCGAEEYAIHDYEGFGSYRLSEYEGIQAAHDVACFIEEHEAVGVGLLSQFCGDLEAAKNALDQHYHGVYESLAYFAEEFTRSTGGEISDNVAMYVDFERMGQDMAINDVFTVNTAHDEVHVFWNH